MQMKKLKIYLNGFYLAQKACVNQNENLKKNLPTKIYIDRKDSLSNTKKLRSITNENEVKNILSKNGFKL